VTDSDSDSNSQATIQVRVYVCFAQACQSRCVRVLDRPLGRLVTVTGTIGERLGQARSDSKSLGAFTVTVAATGRAPELGYDHRTRRPSPSLAADGPESDAGATQHWRQPHGAAFKLGSWGGRRPGPGPGAADQSASLSTAVTGPAAHGTVYRGQRSAPLAGLPVPPAHVTVTVTVAVAGRVYYSTQGFTESNSQGLKPRRLRGSTVAAPRWPVTDSASPTRSLTVR
jgi:hypothetical protein